MPRRLPALLLLAACAGAVPATLPERFTRTGSPTDFAYFEGGWTTVQHRLKTRGAGAHDWEDFPATLCMQPYLGGGASVDELYAPTQGWAGLTVRLFDPQRRQWSAYWVSSRTGRLDTPVVGGFEGARGELYGLDEDRGRPVVVRFTWLQLDRDHARWEQAFSYDGGERWETNWTADFTRADEARVCDRGRPRRDRGGP